MMPQRTFLMMLIVICVTILCFVWMVRDSLCGLRLQQGNTVLVATLVISREHLQFLLCSPPESKSRILYSTFLTSDFLSVFMGSYRTECASFFRRRQS